MKILITKENPFVIKDTSVLPFINSDKKEIRFNVLIGTVNLSTVWVGGDSKKLIFDFDEPEKIILNGYINVILESDDAEVEYELI